MTDEIYDIAILGAGPIGLEAALRAADDGYKTIVIERGEIGQNVRDWGHVKMFSPFGMNSSERGRVLTDVRLDLKSCCCGDQFASAYLVPLSERIASRVSFLTNYEVVDIRRQGWTKSSGVGDAFRARSPFKIDCFSSPVDDTVVRIAPTYAWAVIDATGAFQGGREPQRGVNVQSVEPFIDMLGKRGPLSTKNFVWIGDMQKKRVLLVGSGFTAATDALSLCDSGCHVTWLTRRGGKVPIVQISGDPLPERRLLSERANSLVRSKRVEWIGGLHTVNVSEVFEDPFESPKRLGIKASVSTFSGCSREWSDEHELFDELILDVGFRPNTEIFSELHVHLCYATEGPIKLAAKLLGEAGADCLTQSGSDASLLVNPEPNFFILGAKSYGRNSNFLIKAGIEQVNAVFDELLPKTLWPLIGR